MAKEKTIPICNLLKVPTGNCITDAPLETSNAVLQFDEISLPLVPIIPGVGPVIATAGHRQILETRRLLTKIGLHCLSSGKGLEDSRTEVEMGC